MNALLAKIKTRGHWISTIRPVIYAPERIPTLAALKSALSAAHVKFRGWDYPHMSSRDELRAGQNFIEQGIDWEDHKEAWRFYQSGHFIHYAAVWLDWRDEVRRYTPQTQQKPGEWLSFIDALYFMTEVYEFNARLARQLFPSESVAIRVALSNTKGRELVSLDPGRAWYGKNACASEHLEHEVICSAEQLFAAPAQLALEHYVWLVDRFSWHDPSQHVLKAEQERLLKGEF